MCNTLQRTMPPPRKSVVQLSVASPHMSRARIQPISTPGTRYSQSFSQPMKSQDTDIISLGINQENNSLKPIKLENLNKIHPELTFRSHEVETKTREILAEYLHDKEYDAGQCKNLSQAISAKILEAIKGLGFKRYKMVAVVSIGSMKEKPGMQFGSRCLWNKDTDNFISVKYNNMSIFAVAMVYGLYYN